MVSVICLAYNAEKYIAQCLDGFIRQECEFDYEVIIHDDASRDRTAEIIRDYEKKYPTIIHAIYQDENQYSKFLDTCNPFLKIACDFIIPKARGKYFAFCEGDDYWTDPYKLQRQVNALEQHNECRMSVHKVNVVSESGITTGGRYPNFDIQTGIISASKFIDYNCTNEYVFQTSSYLVNAENAKAFSNNVPKFMKVSATGDLGIMFLFATKGDIYYFADEMSCYRLNSTSSQARREKSGIEETKLQIHFNKQIAMMREYDDYTCGKYHDLCERKIKGYYWDKAVRNHEYKEMINPSYRYFFSKYSLKARIKTYLYAFFPLIMKKYDKQRNER